MHHHHHQPKKNNQVAKLTNAERENFIGLLEAMGQVGASTTTTDINFL